MTFLLLPKVVDCPSYDLMTKVLLLMKQQGFYEMVWAKKRQTGVNIVPEVTKIDGKHYLSIAIYMVGFDGRLTLESDVLFRFVRAIEPNEAFYESNKIHPEFPEVEFIQCILNARAEFAANNKTCLDVFWSQAKYAAQAFEVFGDAVEEKYNCEKKTLTFPAPVPL